jgi:hypothetical protein
LLFQKIEREREREKEELQEGKEGKNIKTVEKTLSEADEQPASEQRLDKDTKGRKSLKMKTSDRR